MKYDQPSDIPDSVLEDIKTKATYIRIARGRANSRGIPLEELPDDDWREIWWNRAKRAADRYQAKKMAEAEEIVATTPRIDIQEDTELADYLEHYANPTPNDIVSLRQLISLEKQLAKIEDLINQTLDPPDDGEVNASRYKTLSGIQKSLSTELRLVQDSLGISRRIRDQQRSESELADHLMANINQARELLDELGLKLYCPYCQAEKGTAILHGFFVHHFPEMGVEIKTRCPQCGKEYTVNRHPQKWERQVGQTRHQQT